MKSTSPVGAKAGSMVLTAALSHGRLWMTVNSSVSVADSIE